MNRTVGIKFKDYGQVYYFDSAGHVFALGDWAMVETDQGKGLGQIVSLHDELPSGISPDQIKPVLAPATDADFVQRDENEALTRQAHRYCRERINERKLEMKLVEVEVFFDRSKIIFYFTAPGRVDFRELVKDLVREYRTRIELRQIGVRHETQMIGAVGNCGQLCCCRRFLRKFDPVTIKMAKEQNLFLNPTKISGICGRLLCCLGYEQHNYEEFQRRCPRIGRRVRTGIGNVKVLRSNFFRETLTVLTEANEEREFTLDEWLEISGGEAPAAGALAQEGGATVQLSETAPAEGGGGDAGAVRPRGRGGQPERTAPAGEGPGASGEGADGEAGDRVDALAGPGVGEALAEPPDDAASAVPDGGADGKPGRGDQGRSVQPGQRAGSQPEGQDKGTGRSGKGRRPRRRGGRRGSGGGQKSES